MIEKPIVFEQFEFPRLSGLEYIVNEDISDTDFLFVNDQGDNFSMYFEKGFPIFTVPEKSERDYGLFELKRQGRIIKFFCPEKRDNLKSVVWYFYVEITDDRGEKHVLPGQVRVSMDVPALIQAVDKPRFIEVLEQVKLS
jgi:hypothetical protein